jgi:hypothetical protein
MVGIGNGLAKGPIMNRISQLVTTVVVAGGLGLAGLVSVFVPHPCP